MVKEGKTASSQILQPPRMLVVALLVFTIMAALRPCYVLVEVAFLVAAAVYAAYFGWQVFSQPKSKGRTFIFFSVLVLTFIMCGFLYLIVRMAFQPFCDPTGHFVTGSLN